MCCIALYCIVLYCIILYYIVFYRIVLNCTVLNSNFLTNLFNYLIKRIGGVPAILLLLDLHSGYCDLHRVAAVVLLRMLQECDHVNMEIAANQGIRILLESLRKGEQV